MLLSLLLFAVVPETQVSGDGTETRHQYEVGSGDVVEITIDGKSELVTVQRDGTISTDAGQFDVEGVTTLEISSKIASRLQELGATTALPTVRVKEYRSRFTFVTGKVRRPGRYYLTGKESVVDILYRAGGLTCRASDAEVVVQSIHREETIRIHLPRGKAQSQQRRALDRRLGRGESISVTCTPILDERSHGVPR